MRISFNRISTALAVAALGVALASVPAEAQQYRHGAGHSGRAWQGAGRSGHWHGGGQGWRGGYWGPAVGLGILGGALMGSGYPYYYGDDDGCYQYQAIYDSWGRYLGRRLVNVCY